MLRAFGHLGWTSGSARWKEKRGGVGGRMSTFCKRLPEVCETCLAPRTEKGSRSGVEKFCRHSFQRGESRFGERWTLAREGALPGGVTRMGGHSKATNFHGGSLWVCKALSLSSKRCKEKRRVSENRRLLRKTGNLLQISKPVTSRKHTKLHTPQFEYYIHSIGRKRSKLAQTGA